jgi:Glycosyl transferase family 2
MASKNIKFTVIIPTCARSDTLKWALKSCVNQDYENLEIIVSDNFSQDQTAEVVKAYQDPRIKYINPGRRLGMSSHWEFALSHASGDYVNFIGDDDAMLPRAFDRLNEIINNLNCQALCWIKDDFVYFWPRTKNANLLSVSLWGKPDIVEINSQTVLDRVQAFQAGYNTLPMIYSGVISRSVIEKIKSYTGTFFTATTPDIYSGTIVASELASFHRSGTPYSMTGCSSHSTGASVLGGEKSDPSSGIQFLQENDRSFHPQVGSNLLNIEMYVADCILITKDILGHNKSLNINFADLMTSIMRQGQLVSPAKYPEYAQVVQTIGERNGLSELATSIIRKFPNKRMVVKEINLLARANSIGTVAYLNCQELGISNVYDAALLTDSILTLHRTGCLSLTGKIQNFMQALGKKKV